MIHSTPRIISISSGSKHFVFFIDLTRNQRDIVLSLHRGVFNKAGLTKKDAFGNLAMRFITQSNRNYFARVMSKALGIFIWVRPMPKVNYSATYFGQLESEVVMESRRVKLIDNEGNFIS